MLRKRSPSSAGPPPLTMLVAFGSGAPDQSEHGHDGVLNEKRSGSIALPARSSAPLTSAA